MFDWKKYLSPHGQSKEACEYVLRRFGNIPEEYSSNLLMKRWVECSKQCLEELYPGQN
jgi:hypothetical protein